MGSQKPMSEKSSTDEKKYFLSEEEKVNLQGRYGIIKQYQYLLNVINMDIQAYMRFEVLKRLGIDANTNYVLSKDNSYITLPGGEHEKPASPRT